MTYENTIKQIINLINRSNNILVLPSNPADGDSIGSALAFYIALKKLNKKVRVVCSEPIPEVLGFLPKVSAISKTMNTSNDFIISIDNSELEITNIRTLTEGKRFNIVITPKNRNINPDEITFHRGESEYDLIITVDCAELKQLRSVYTNNTELFHTIPVINIDHHISNTNYGKINHVDVMASSATEMIFSILKNLSDENNTQLIDEDVATLLLTGIITDTGSFQNSNTTPRSFAKAAELVAYGARQQEIIQQIYKTKHLSQLKLWGRVLSKIQTDDLHRIVWSVVTQQDLKETESSIDQTGDIIDELMTNAPGAEVVMLVKEKTDGQISVSLRTTNPSIDASAIAEHFGGGGHTQAAGFIINGKKPTEAEYIIINHIKKYQSQRLKLNPESNTPQVTPMIDVDKLINKIKVIKEENKDSLEIKLEVDASEKEQKHPEKSQKNKKESENTKKTSDKKSSPMTHKVIYHFEE